MIERYKAHAVGSSFGPPLLEHNAQTLIAEFLFQSELLAAEINYMAKRETELQNDHMNLRSKSQANVWLTSTCRTQEHALQATDEKINLQDTKNMPYRPLKCQSCCPGFFCPGPLNSWQF
ncbi:hypothetical protein ZEAMMB73_Zm00001d023739 [Zea mays]|uniref:Uncharacterized protein n=1 Tax=Zea mays TaxID=4577 RepID=A0A1D6IVA0_MAIZE|nr:hypothetical protein ZEAMMB73_Zm00001d023739 [Zea mays]